MALTRMDRLTITQRIKIIENLLQKWWFCQSHVSWFKGLHNHPTTQVIGKIVKKFEGTGFFTSTEMPVHHRFAHSTENIAIASKTVPEDLNVSILRPHYGIMFNWCLNNRRYTTIFRTKYSSAMKDVSHSVVMLINKIIIFYCKRHFLAT